jgi:hypothetical protein
MRTRIQKRVDYVGLTEVGGPQQDNLPDKDTLIDDNSRTYVKASSYKFLKLGCFAKGFIKGTEYIGSYAGTLWNETQLHLHQQTTKKNASHRVLELPQDIPLKSEFVVTAIDGSKDCNVSYINCTLQTQVPLDLC